MLRRQKRSQWKRQHKGDADGSCLPLLPPTLIVAFCLLAFKFIGLCCDSSLRRLVSSFSYYPIQPNPPFLLYSWNQFTKLENVKYMQASLNTLPFYHGKLTIASFTTTTICTSIHVHLLDSGIGQRDVLYIRWK